MLALRERIAAFYRERYGVTLDPQRVVITPGASAALQLVMAVLVNAGDEVLMADPGYPCNRNFVYLLGGRPVGIPVGAASVYQPAAKQVSDVLERCDEGLAGGLAVQPDRHSAERANPA